jgi:hypothetical protein
VPPAGSSWPAKSGPRPKKIAEEKAARTAAYQSRAAARSERAAAASFRWENRATCLMRLVRALLPSEPIMTLPPGTTRLASLPPYVLDALTEHANTDVWYSGARGSDTRTNHVSLEPEQGLTHTCLMYLLLVHDETAFYTTVNDMLHPSPISLVAAHNERLRFPVTADDIYAPDSALSAEFAKICATSDNSNLLAILQNGYIGDSLSHVSLPSADSPTARITVSGEGKGDSTHLTEHVRYHSGRPLSTNTTVVAVAPRTTTEDSSQLAKTIATVLSAQLESSSSAKTVGASLMSMLTSHTDVNPVDGLSHLYERLFRAMFAAEIGVTSNAVLTADRINNAMPYKGNDIQNNVWSKSNTPIVNLDHALASLNITPDHQLSRMLVPIAGIPNLFTAPEANRIIQALIMSEDANCGFTVPNSGRGIASVIENVPALTAPYLFIALTRSTYAAVSSNFGNNNIWVPPAPLAAGSLTASDFRNAISFLLLTVGGQGAVVEAYNTVARESAMHAGPQISLISSPLNVRYVTGADPSLTVYNRLAYMYTRDIRNRNAAGDAALNTAAAQWAPHPHYGSRLATNNGAARSTTVRDALLDKVFYRNEHRSTVMSDKTVNPCTGNAGANIAGYFGNLRYHTVDNDNDDEFRPAESDVLTDLEVDHYWYHFFINADMSSMVNFFHEIAALPTHVTNELLIWAADLESTNTWAARWNFVQTAHIRAVSVAPELRSVALTSAEIRNHYAYNIDFLHTTTGVVADRFTELYAGLTQTRNRLLSINAVFITDLDRALAQDLKTSSPGRLCKGIVLRTLCMRAGADTASILIGTTPGFWDSALGGMVSTNSPAANLELTSYRLPGFTGNINSATIKYIQTWDMVVRKYGIIDMLATEATTSPTHRIRHHHASNIASRYPSERDISPLCIHPQVTAILLPGIPTYSQLNPSGKWLTRTLADFPSAYSALTAAGTSLTRCMTIAAGEKHLFAAGLNQRMLMNITLRDADASQTDRIFQINEHYMCAAMRPSDQNPSDPNLAVSALSLMRSVLEPLYNLTEPALPDQEVRQDPAFNENIMLRSNYNKGGSRHAIIPCIDWHNMTISDMRRMPTLPALSVLNAFRLNPATLSQPLTQDNNRGHVGIKLITGYTNNDVFATPTLWNIALHSRTIQQRNRVKDGYSLTDTYTTTVASRARATDAALNVKFVHARSAGINTKVPTGQLDTDNLLDDAYFYHTCRTFAPRGEYDDRDFSSTCRGTAAAFISVYPKSKLRYAYVWQKYAYNFHPLIAPTAYRYTSVDIAFLTDAELPPSRSLQPTKELNTSVGTSWSGATRLTSSDTAAEQERFLVEEKLREQATAAAVAEASASTAAAALESNATAASTITVPDSMLSNTTALAAGLDNAASSKEAHTTATPVEKD